MSRYKTSQAGFTLVEIAVVLLIGAILLAAGGGMLHIYIQHERMRITQNRMQEIDDAIIQYQNANGVLPCVAGMTDTPDTSAFGKQVTVAGGIHGGATGPGFPCKVHAAGPGGAWNGTGLTPPLALPNASAVIIGAVPVFTLGLPDQDIADAWGNRFAYVVTENLTITNKYSQTQGAIRVRDSVGTNIAPAGPLSAITPAAQYAIISYGPDGAGSYTFMGVKNGKACPAGPTPAMETPNCNIFKNGPLANLVMTMQNSNRAGSASMFDDYVIFHTATPSTSLTPMGTVAPIKGACPTGWQAYAGAACTPSGLYTCCQKY